ncbi:medium chain dehydrogenase/reductase family protein [Streptomyces sp. CB01881]|uniref:MDR/zinc-dependent alcohol dehydrogenase-like family protein n=1 Tax=Streptomyces sp. CB01881 TaxID=2078691 RepID=UPI001F11D48F|nr:medium chain dehydrogenase/reductase family protein [Streptomyces sp. CB01881]
MRVVLEPGGPRFDPGPPERPPGEHAVRVRIELAGVCRSDLKEVAGSRYGVSQFGHELVGVVEESTLPGLPPGQRVTLDPNVAIERSTGFATTMWAAGPADRLGAALPAVQRHIPARTLVFTEPLACARHCLARAARHLDRDLAGVRLGVLGAGAAGVLIAALARTMGLDVVLTNRTPDRRAFLRERGIVDVPIGPTASVPTGALDVAVLATSFIRPDVLREALRMTTRGGLLLLYGGTAPGDSLPGLDCDLDTVRRREGIVTTGWQGREVRIAGTYGTVPADFEAALGDLAGPAIAPHRIERMIARQVGLVELPGVLREQTTGRHLGKTLVVP